MSGSFEEAEALCADKVTTGGRQYRLIDGADYAYLKNEPKTNWENFRHSE